MILSSSQAWGQERIASEVPGATQLKVKLKRLVVGNQGSILKIWKADENSVPDYYRGLDDRTTAPYTGKDQKALVESLGMTQMEVEQSALDIVEGYSQMPKKNALAFLGLVNSIEQGSEYAPSPTTKSKIKSFLLTRLTEDKSVIMRRQACLSLAVGAQTDHETIDAVLSFYRASENLWETFPVQQFFEYHADAIRGLTNFSDIRSRAASVNSLYTSNILGYLDGR